MKGKGLLHYIQSMEDKPKVTSPGSMGKADIEDLIDQLRKQPRADWNCVMTLDLVNSLDDEQLSISVQRGDTYIGTPEQVELFEQRCKKLGLI